MNLYLNWQEQKVGTVCIRLVVHIKSAQQIYACNSGNTLVIHYFICSTYPVVVPYQNLTLAINWCSSRLWHSFIISTPVHRFPHANDTQSKNIFRWLPRAHLPSIFPVSAISSSSFFLSTWPKNLICLDVITCKRLLCVSALSSTASLVNLSVHEIRIMRLRNHNSVASSRVLICCY